MKKAVMIVLSLVLMVVSLMGCAGKKTSENKPSTPATQEALKPVEINIGSLKGPTSMGLLYLMNQAENNKAKNAYSFSMYTAADELLPLITKGAVDIAMIPANAASILYNKTKGGISVIDINTLGVLYIVSSNEAIGSIKDLKDKTIYMTGKGTIPEYVINYLLSANGLRPGDDVTIEFKSEPTEVASILSKDPGSVGVLPQPFATSALMQSSDLKLVMDLTQQWNDAQGSSGSAMITGVTIVRNEFLDKNEEAVKAFLQEHKASAEYMNSNPQQAAQLVEKSGIVAKAAIAQKAIPYCNITYIDGENMKTALSGYLKVLYEQKPEAVGGKLPEDGFYYIP